MSGKTGGIKSMKLTKKLTAMAMAVLMAASLMACGGKDAAEPATNEAETQETQDAGITE